jgi:quercetin dioxygenase-like cupin family protein
MKRLILTPVLLLISFIFVYSSTSFAQDAAKVDSIHYKVEFENDHVRVLRITYGPGEKSVMHSHPESVGVFLTDGAGRFNLPDGKTEDIEFKAGLVNWMPALTHQPENTGKESFEVIQIEMKTK